MTFQEFAIEGLRLVVPAVLAYIGVMRTRVELDILYAKQRGCEESQMRRRWYTPMFYKRKEIANVASLSSTTAVESSRQDGDPSVPEERKDQGTGGR